MHQLLRLPECQTGLVPLQRALWHGDAGDRPPALSGAIDFSGSIQEGGAFRRGSGVPPDVSGSTVPAGQPASALGLQETPD